MEHDVVVEAAGAGPRLDRGPGRGDALQVEISVPFTLTERYLYRSGATFSGPLDGTYEGVNSHDLTVTLTGSAYPQAPATITKTQAASRYHCKQGRPNRSGCPGGSVA